MVIAKNDELTPKVFRVQDKNPLNSIDITVDVLYIEEGYPRDAKGAIKIHEKEIFQALSTLFNGMFINLRDEAPLGLQDGAILIKVKIDKIENIKTELRHLSYGVLEDQTDINCKPSKACGATLKIMSDRVQEK